jgi:hypothetical protein
MTRTEQNELADLIARKAAEFAARGFGKVQYRDLLADRSDPACCPKCWAVHGSYPCPVPMKIWRAQ